LSADNLYEFKNNREKLDSIIGQITGLIQIFAFQEAEQKLQEVNELKDG
jgi:cell fate (sporulation/competence/biofilm development) regulator YlbF (YheA/YmcA/DUF963 family)